MFIYTYMYVKLHKLFLRFNIDIMQGKGFKFKISVTKSDIIQDSLQINNSQMLVLTRLMVKN